MSRFFGGKAGRPILNIYKTNIKDISSSENAGTRDAFSTTRQTPSDTRRVELCGHRGQQFNVSSNIHHRGLLQYWRVFIPRRLVSRFRATFCVFFATTALAPHHCLFCVTYCSIKTESLSSLLRTTREYWWQRLNPLKLVVGGHFRSSSSPLVASGHHRR